MLTNSNSNSNSKNSILAAAIFCDFVLIEVTTKNKLNRANTSHIAMLSCCLTADCGLVVVMDQQYQLISTTINYYQLLSTTINYYKS